jgi:Transposase DDE domain
VVHLDATLIRADVSWDRIARRHADAVDAANGDGGEAEGGGGGGEGGPARQPPGKPPPCTTDPAATLVRNHQARRSEPSYEQHTAVDGQAGVVLDVVVTTGAVHDTMTTEAQLGPARRSAPPHRPPDPDRDPGRELRHHARLRRPRTPRHRGRGRGADQARAPAEGRRPGPPFQAGRPPRHRALPAWPHPAPTRQAERQGFPGLPREADRLPALPAARRLHRQQGPAPRHPAARGPRRATARPAQARPVGRERGRAIYGSHRGRVEGVHGEAKTWHGLARAVRRGLANIQIQAYLTAAAINLERLAPALLALLAVALLICAARRCQHWPPRLANG